ncbi:uncharacterized protein [Epargyreus clarus]|uniref:uncharacterized protein n=1 Tax=Epargyreus clarus TaxID=520877 RepID=UPI003C2C707F
MNSMNFCRTCMSTASLTPIFPLPDMHERFSNTIYLITGIKVQMYDDLPQKMCLDCLKQVNGAIKFRAKCKATEEKLQELKKQTHSVNNNEYNTNKIQINTLDGQTITVKNEKLLVNNKVIEYNDKSFDNDKNLNLNNVVENLSVNECNETYNSILEYGKNENMLHIDEAVKTEGSKEIESRDESIENTDINMHSIEYSSLDNINVAMESLEMKTPTLYEIDMTREGNRVTCKLCQKNLSIRSIEVHLSRSHPGADGRRVKCNLCDSFITREKMTRHRVMMHGSETLQCRYCKSAFEMEDQLMEHIGTCMARKKRNNSEMGREMTECDVCHKSMQRASLRLHKAIKHAGLGPVCEHCGKRFGNKFRLIEHYRAKHGYEKFKCSFCEFQSASGLAMRNHERRHRGEKPFVCESCGAKFHAAYLLAQHRQSHRTDRTYKCETCSARFKTNNALHAHRRARHSRVT